MSQQRTSTRHSSNTHVGSSAADILKSIGVNDALVAVKALAILKAAGYIPKDKLTQALKLARQLK